MGTAAIVSLLGSTAYEVEPGLLDRFWEADEVLSTVLFGPPRWAFPGAYARMEAFWAASGRVFEAACARFDWDGPDADADWEPVFGSRFFREMARWMKQCDFSPKTCAGMTAVTGIVA